MQQQRVAWIAICARPRAKASAGRTGYVTACTVPQQFGSVGPGKKARLTPAAAVVASPSCLPPEDASPSVATAASASRADAVSPPTRWTRAPSTRRWRPGPARRRCWGSRRCACAARRCAAPADRRGWPRPREGRYTEPVGCRSLAPWAAPRTPSPRRAHGASLGRTTWGTTGTRKGRRRCQERRSTCSAVSRRCPRGPIRPRRWPGCTTTWRQRGS